MELGDAYFMLEKPTRFDWEKNFENVTKIQLQLNS